MTKSEGKRLSKTEQTKCKCHAGSVRMTELLDSHPELDNSKKKTPLEHCK